jgi:eukaryotic-like serine/threonine-protein kinase
MSGDRLDSWKEIAAHFNRSVRTVTRWEREEGLPVHRHFHARAGSVYAFKAELDAWWSGRGKELESRVAAETAGAQRNRLNWVPAAVASAVLGLTGIVWLAVTQRGPAVVSRLVPLTTYPGEEGPPSLSPDGNQVTFERAGDIFVKQVDGEGLVRLTTTEVGESAPAWSPDGRWIAFTREREGIFVTSPLGGGERKIAETRVPLLLKTIAWTPDSQSLVVSQLTSSICASLFLVSVATGEKSQLTWPPEPSIGDGWPSISPDGTTLAFARYSQDTSANIHIVSLRGGDPRQLTADKASISGLAWANDVELVFASDRDGTFRLWRASVKDVANVAPLQGAGEDARFPSISRHDGARNARLAYQRFVQNLDIRRVELVAEGTPQHTMRSSESFIASTKSEDHPRYSPDGTKIAFVSGRSGAQEIWLCSSTASNPRRLTSMGGPVVVGPQWSPDGRRIAYFATTGVAGKYAVYTIDAEGGQPSRMTRSENDLEALPTWSRDGRWIYLASARSSVLQIWKMPVNGGEPLQLTQNGGAEAAESLDGRTVYYAKVPEMGPGLWSVPSTGGAEVRVLDSVRFGYWAIARTGIYFIDFDVPNDAPRPLKFFNFETGAVTQAGAVERTVAWTNTPGFSVSPDGRWLLYSSLESTDGDLMLLDGLR